MMTRERETAVARGGYLRRIKTFASTAVLFIVRSAAVAICTNGSSAGIDRMPGVVYRDGAQLMLDGVPYRFVGVNNYDLTGCHTGRPVSDADADAFFAQLPPNSMTRVWAFQPWGADSVARTVRIAEKHGQKLTLVLADGGGQCSEPRYDSSWYREGFRGAYLGWIAQLASMFRGSPAVAIWELMNEPGADAEDLTPTAIKTFYDEAAARVKQADPTHLVSTGALAPFQSFQSGVDGYRDAHSGPDIDLVSVHEYDYAYSGGQSVVSQQFDIARDAAAQLGKPVYVGEAGVSLSSGCMTAEQRADVLRQKFDAYLGAGSSGVLYRVVLGPPNNPGSVCDEQFGNRDPMLGGPVMQMIGGYRR